MGNAFLMGQTGGGSGGGGSYPTTLNVGSLQMRFENSDKRLVITIPDSIDPWKIVAIYGIDTSSSSVNANEIFQIRDYNLTVMFKCLLTGDTSYAADNISSLFFTWKTSDNTIDFSGYAHFSPNGAQSSTGQNPGISLYMDDDRHYRLEILGTVYSDTPSIDSSGNVSFSWNFTLYAVYTD